jgi:DNA-binding transcriptional LysR family regulator
MAVVGSPGYFTKHPPPRTPQDLTMHDCINLRLLTHGLYAWKLAITGRELRVRVDGRLVFNTSALILSAAAAGFGLGLSH